MARLTPDSRRQVAAACTLVARSPFKQTGKFWSAKEMVVKEALPA
jgi:hypothetical protein